MDIVIVVFRTVLICFVVFLLLQLRQHKRQHAADVKFVVLDPSGKPSIREKDCKKSSLRVEEERSGCVIRYEGLPLPLIMNGKVQDNQLEKLGQTRFWLKNQLQAMGIFDFKEVFFCSIDHRGKIFLDRKR